MIPAWEEYRALWRHYGVEVALRAPSPRAVHDYLVRVEAPKEPIAGFVICLPKEDLRFRKDEEALWERILHALELERGRVALIQVSCLRTGAALTWDHLREALPATIHTLIFFGSKSVPADAAGTGGHLPWSGEGQWLVTHELGRLLRDAQAKKETWGALKDLSHRLK